MVKLIGRGIHFIDMAVGYSSSSSGGNSVSIITLEGGGREATMFCLRTSTGDFNGLLHLFVVVQSPRSVH